MILILQLNSLQELRSEMERTERAGGCVEPGEEGREGVGHRTLREHQQTTRKLSSSGLRAKIFYPVRVVELVGLACCLVSLCGPVGGDDPVRGSLVFTEGWASLQHSSICLVAAR